MLPQSLRFKVCFYVALALTATLLLFAVLAVRQQRNSLLESAEDHVNQLSEAIVRSTRFAMLQNQPEYVHRIIQDVARGGNIDRVRIFSKEGVIIDSKRLTTFYPFGLVAKPNPVCALRSGDLDASSPIYYGRSFAATWVGYGHALLELANQSAVGRVFLLVR